MIKTESLIISSLNPRKTPNVLIIIIEGMLSLKRNNGATVNKIKYESRFLNWHVKYYYSLYRLKF